MYIYLNGSYFHHDTGKTTPINGNDITSFKIGQAYPGHIDEFRIWKSARTEQEIRDNYKNYDIDPNDSDLLAYFKFDQTTAQVDLQDPVKYVVNIATQALNYTSHPGGSTIYYHGEPWIPSTAPVQIKPVGFYKYYDMFHSPLQTDTDDAVIRLKSDIQDNLSFEVAMFIEHDFTGSKSGGYFVNIGNPSYPTGKQWKDLDSQVTDLSIDAFVKHEFHIDTRYVLESYTIKNDSGINATAVTSLPPEDQPIFNIPPFVLSSSTKITFKWKTQYSVEIRAVPSLPNSGIDLVSLSVIRPNPTTQSNQIGTGKWWYDKGTILESKAINPTNSCPLMCKGFFDNSDPTQSTVNPYTTKQIPDTNSGLTQGALLIWKYEPPIYKEQVTIGNPLSLRNMTQEHRSMIDFTREPVLPSIQNNEKLFYWDNTENKVYPLIGTRTFKIEWYFKPNMNCSTKIVSEISTTWPTSMKQTQYDHIANTPPVILDPDPNDDIMFNSLQYTEADGNVSQNGEFTAINEGKSVLLFDLIKPVIKDKVNSKVLHYDFNQSSGTTVEDKSGNGNHLNIARMGSKPITEF